MVERTLHWDEEPDRVAVFVYCIGIGSIGVAQEAMHGCTMLYH